MTEYPTRSANTMSDAIALSSPSGRMSTRARAAAERRLSVALFGPNGLQREPTPQPTERERDLRVADELEALADRGMRTRSYRKQAAALRAKHA